MRGYYKQRVILFYKIDDGSKEARGADGYLDGFIVKASIVGKGVTVESTRGRVDKAQMEKLEAMRHARRKRASKTRIYTSLGDALLFIVQIKWRSELKRLVTQLMFNPSQIQRRTRQLGLAL